MDSDKKSNYNKDFKPLERKLTNDSTKGDIILWTEFLSKRKMLGLQFLQKSHVWLLNLTWPQKNITVNFY